MHTSVNSAIHQTASIVSSTISIAWSMASYHKNVRIAFENRKNIGYTGVFLQFLWHIMITGMFKNHFLMCKTYQGESVYNLYLLKTYSNSFFICLKKIFSSIKYFKLVKIFLETILAIILEKYKISSKIL